MDVNLIAFKVLRFKIYFQGTILEQGTYKELLKSGLDFFSLVQNKESSPPITNDYLTNGIENDYLSKSLHVENNAKNVHSKLSLSLRNLSNHHKHNNEHLSPLIKTSFKPKSESNLSRVKATSMRAVESIENVHFQMQSMISLSSIESVNEDGKVKLDVKINVQSSRHSLC